MGGASTSGALNHLAGANEDVESTAGFEEALQQELEPPARRKSVQFIPGEWRGKHCAIFFVGLVSKA